MLNAEPTWTMTSIRNFQIKRIEYFGWTEKKRWDTVFWLKKYLVQLYAILEIQASEFRLIIIDDLIIILPDKSRAAEKPNLHILHRNKSTEKVMAEKLLPHLLPYFFEHRQFAIGTEIFKTFVVTWKSSRQFREIYENIFDRRNLGRNAWHNHFRVDWIVK